MSLVSLVGGSTVVEVVTERGLEGVDTGADLGGDLTDGGGGDVGREGEGAVGGGGGEKVRKIETGRGATEVEDGGVVGSGGGDGRGVGTEPDSGAFVGLTNFGDPFPPLSHPYPFVRFCVLPVPPFFFSPFHLSLSLSLSPFAEN